MSKGYSRKEEYPLKKGEKSRQGVDKRGYERQYTSSDDPGDKRPSVFDRLGSKGCENEGVIILYEDVI